MSAPPERESGSESTLTLFVVCAASALLLLNISAPNTLLPDITDDLGADFSQSSLIISGYSLMLAAMLLTGGTLADLHGRRRMFLVGMGVFGAGSVGCALAPDANVLIGFRALQGVGAAVIFSSGLGLLAQEYEGAARGRALGVWGATIAGAFTIGPLEGGVLTDTLGWRSLFWVNVLLALPVAWIAATRLRESSDPGTRGVDWLGVALLVPALTAGVLALVRGNALGWGSPEILGLAAGALVGLVLFVLWQLRRDEPMLDLHLFRIPTFTGSVFVTMMMSAASFAPVFYLTVYLLEVEGSSPPMAGLKLAPYTAVAFASALLAGRQTERVPLGPGLAAGMSLLAGGTLMLLTAGDGSYWTSILPGLLVCGLGVGVINPLGTYATLATVPTSRSGTAAGANNTFRQLGVAAGIAALGAMLQASLRSGVRDEITGTPADRGRSAEVADQVGRGDLEGALDALPTGARDSLSRAYDVAYVDALHEVLLVSAGLAALGAVAALVLIRRRDLVGGGEPIG